MKYKLTLMHPFQAKIEGIKDVQLKDQAELNQHRSQGMGVTVAWAISMTWKAVGTDGYNYSAFHNILITLHSWLQI